MTREEAKKLLVNHFFTKNGSFSTAFTAQWNRYVEQSWFQDVKSGFLNKILKKYPDNPETDRLRIFLFLTDNDNVQALPKCLKCGREVSVRLFSKGFPKQCTDINCQGKVDPIIQGTITTDYIKTVRGETTKVSTQLCDPELQKILGEICDKNGRIQGSKVRLFLEDPKNVKQVYDLMKKHEIKHIKHVNSQTINEIIYCIQNGIKELPVCPICGNPTRFISRESGYSKTCSSKSCQAKYSVGKRLEKRKKGQQVLIQRAGKKKVWKKFVIRENSTESVEEQDDVKLGDSVLNVSEWCNNLKPKFRKYLTEAKLKYFVAKNLRYDNLYDTNQVKVHVNGKNLRPDIAVVYNKKLYLFEFDGFQHYTKTSVVERDLQLKEFCKKHEIILIQIPYFVQLSSTEVVEHFIPKELILQNLDLRNFQYPQGFIDPQAVLPADFCTRGIERFVTELRNFPKNLSKEIILSLESKVKALGDDLSVYPSKQIRNELLKLAGL